MATVMSKESEQPSFLTVGVLREAFRHLQAFRVLYEDTGVDTLEAEGVSICLWDLEYLYEQIHLLPPRQAQAIELFLVQNIKEVDVARLMGLKPQPVGMYASLGLEKLIDMVERGDLPRYLPQWWD